MDLELVRLDRDHPGFRDEAYRARRNAIAALALISGTLAAQRGASGPPEHAKITPVNNLPNPYETVRNWGTLPNGRRWGSVSAIHVDADGKHIWAGDRCGTNSCAGSDVDPIVKLDPSDARYASDLLACLTNLGLSQLHSGQVKESRDTLEQALAAYQVQVDEHPELKTDEKLIEHESIGYLGMIGSRGKVGRFKKRLEAKGLLASEAARARWAAMRAPIGLDLGAETPQEIAVSIAAELIALRRRGSSTVGDWRPAKHHGESE